MRADPLSCVLVDPMMNLTNQAAQPEASKVLEGSECEDEFMEFDDID